MKPLLQEQNGMVQPEAKPIEEDEAQPPNSQSEEQANVNETAAANQNQNPNPNLLSSLDHNSQISREILSSASSVGNSTPRASGSTAGGKSPSDFEGSKTVKKNDELEGTIRS